MNTTEPTTISIAASNAAPAGEGSALQLRMSGAGLKEVQSALLGWMDLPQFFDGGESSAAVRTGPETATRIEQMLDLLEGFEPTIWRKSNHDLRDWEELSVEDLASLARLEDLALGEATDYAVSGALSSAAAHKGVPEDRLSLRELVIETSSLEAMKYPGSDPDDLSGFRIFARVRVRCTFECEGDLS